MEVLASVFYGNTVRTWVAALAVSAAVLTGALVLRSLLIRRLATRARETKTDLDDLAVQVLQRTRPAFFLALSLSIGSQILDLPRVPARVISTLIAIVTLLQIGFWGDRLASYLIERYARTRGERDSADAPVVGALGFLARLVFWTLIAFLALDNLGVEITALVTGLGIGGIAVALAAQHILGDLFASFAIVFDRPFTPGDFIVVGDYTGTIERIGLKTTRIRSLSGEQIILTNSDLIASRVRNFERMAERRVAFTIGVAYGTPVEKLEAIPTIIREVISAQNHVRFDRAHFTAYGDFALRFEIVFYVIDPSFTVYMDLLHAVNLEIFRKFHEEGIEFAHLPQTIYREDRISGAKGARTSGPPTGGPD